LARYYFNIHDGKTVIPDPDGDELSDTGAALDLVEKVVRDVVARPQAYGDFSRWAGRKFVVTDDAGREVVTVPMAAPLVHGWRDHI
jgi:hypothetical protein